MDGVPHVVLVEMLRWAVPDAGDVVRLACVNGQFERATRVLGMEFASGVFHSENLPKDIHWSQLLKLRAFREEEAELPAEELVFVWFDIYELSAVVGDIRSAYASCALRREKDNFQGRAVFIGYEAIDEPSSFECVAPLARLAPHGIDEFGLALDEAIVQIKGLTKNHGCSLLFQWACCDDDDFQVNGTFLEFQAQSECLDLDLHLGHPFARHRISQISINFQLKEPSSSSSSSDDRPRRRDFSRRQRKTYNVTLQSKLLHRTSDSFFRRKNTTARKRPRIMKRPPGNKLQLILEAKEARDRLTRAANGFTAIPFHPSQHSSRYTPPPARPILERIADQRREREHATTSSNNHNVA